jgi:hypothetical protein
MAGLATVGCLTFGLTRALDRGPVTDRNRRSLAIRVHIAEGLNSQWKRTFEPDSEGPIITIIRPSHPDARFAPGLFFQSVCHFSVSGFLGAGSP